jgi:hypothetical protein
MKDRRQKAEDESAIQDYFREDPPQASMPSPPIRHKVSNQLQGSQARFRALKPTSRLVGPFARKHNRSKAQLLESTMARKPKKWIASRKPSSSRVATHQSSQTVSNHRKKVSLHHHYSQSILPHLHHPPRRSTPQAYRKIAGILRVCSRLYSKNKQGCTRYPGVHSTFTCYQPTCA